MKIVSLAENTSQKGLPTEHGLSLYLETKDKLRILFDMGQSSLFAENAERLSISIQDINLAILSHGHYDHGGGLETFLNKNNKAPIYVHQTAFEPHFSLRTNDMHYIGLDIQLQHHPRLVFCKEYTSIFPNVQLFTQTEGDCLCPPGNRLLYGPTPHTNDHFGHEQSLLIQEGQHIILIAGCAHTGIINILKKAQSLTNKPITHVLAGMHLKKNGLSPNEEAIFIESLAQHLLSYPHCQYYTMHCTGEEGFAQLQQHMGSRIKYLSTGDQLIIR